MNAELWIEENQTRRRNLSDDQRAILWDSIAEKRSKLRAVEHSTHAANVRHGNLCPSDNASDKQKPKLDTRKEVAAESRIPERKLKAAREIKKTKAPNSPPTCAQAVSPDSADLDNSVGMLHGRSR